MSATSKRRSDYVTVRLTVKQAYALANAAQNELDERDATNSPHADDATVSVAIEKVLDEWRKAPGDWKAKTIH